VGAPFDGWNVISVPAPVRNGGGPGGFVVEVIPYKETLTFRPVVQAGNRGVFTGDNQAEQLITGLVYEQRITSVCNAPKCVEMGFGEGQEIHVETGLLLYIKDCVKTDKNDTSCAVADLNIARLATIPHGNSVLALGSFDTKVPDDNNFFPEAPTRPVVVNKGDAFQLGYNNVFGPPFMFPQFATSDPNRFLQNTLNDRLQVIEAMTTIHMSSTNASGGILNIPFNKTDIKTTDMQATFYIQQIKGSKDLQLQYTQTINLVFPGLNNEIPAKPIPAIWPHITVNTLTKVK